MTWRDAPEAEFAVIGHPVSHSRSPAMHVAAYGALGLPYRYVALDVPSGEVADALNWLRERGYRGVNVTVPHKEAAWAWCSKTSEEANRVRGANTLKLPEREGTSTDGAGFLLGMGEDLPGGPVLLLGAGGSARAVAHALVGSGRAVRVWNRTPNKARDLAQEIGGEWAQSLDPTGCATVVNATSTSLQGEPLPVPWTGEETAIDLMYGDGPTPFLQHAAWQCVERLYDGRPMLAGQGALAFQWWLGPCPYEVMREALV